MAARNETLLHPSFKPSRKRNAHGNVNLVFSAALLAGSAAGLGWVISNIDNSSTQPSASETQILQEDFPTPPALSEQEKKAINKVPLAEITKKQGVVAMVQFGKEVNAINPYGASISFQDGTIVNVQKDTVNNKVWVALAFGGDKLTKTDTGNTVTNFDGTKTELYLYKGFTAWVEIDNNVVVVQDGSKYGNQGLGFVEKYLKIGNSIDFNVNLNDNGGDYFRTTAAMNRYSLSLLDKESRLSKPNIDKSGQTLKFRADFAFVNTNQPSV